MGAAHIHIMRELHSALWQQQLDKARKLTQQLVTHLPHGLALRVLRCVKLEAAAAVARSVRLRCRSHICAQNNTTALPTPSLGMDRLGLITHPLLHMLANSKGAGLQDLHSSSYGQTPSLIGFACKVQTHHKARYLQTARLRQGLCSVRACTVPALRLAA